MRKYYLISVFFLSLTSQISSQDWFWQNPLPQVNALNSVYFIDTNTGWAVGDDGTMLKTTDGGLTWSLIPSGRTELVFSDLDL